MKYYYNKQLWKLVAKTRNYVLVANDDEEEKFFTLKQFKEYFVGVEELKRII